MNSKPRFQIPDGSQQSGPDHIDPSLVNDDLEWISDVSNYLGLTVAQLEFDGANIDAVLHHAGPGFERIMGDELKAAKLGEFDSIRRGDPFRIYFHLSTEFLPAALSLVKESLQTLNILQFCKIATADVESRVWRVFHPAPPGSDQGTK